MGGVCSEGVEFGEREPDGKSSTCGLKQVTENRRQKAEGRDGCDGVSAVSW
jgi:hypothetical protein